MWTGGLLQAIGDNKISSILGPSEILQWLAPPLQVLKPHLESTFEFLETLIRNRRRYTKSADEQLSEDSQLLDGLLLQLKHLAESVEGASDV
jgi:hypothetical protein